MNRLKVPTPIDLAPFSPFNNDPQALYGLPRDVKFCNTCVISNQRPVSANEFAHTHGTRKTSTIVADDGVCDGCKYAKIKEGIDWKEREKALTALCDRYRRYDGRYDVIVPGSGGKDSIFAAHLLKTKYNMHPLTMTWAPHIYTDWGWKNFQAWVHAGFDNHLFTPNGRVHRLLTRLAIENLFHPFQPFIMGQKAYAPKMAAILDIPFVMYGENPAEYGNAIDQNFTPKREWSQFSAEDPSATHLGGVSLDGLKADFGLTDHDLAPYIPARTADLQVKGVDVQFLGYYVRWHVQGNYYYAKEHSGFEPAPERTPGTYSKYNSIDDKIDDFHYYTTFVKFGIGRATYESCFEIRNDDLARDEAVNLVKKYDGEFPERFADEIFAYLSLPPEEFPVASKMFEQSIMDRAYFERLTDSYRSPHIWKREGDTWVLRRTVWEDR